jgi:hypothetical protein
LYPQALDYGHMGMEMRQWLCSEWLGQAHRWQIGRSLLVLVPQACVEQGPAVLNAGGAWALLLYF